MKKFSVKNIEGTWWLICILAMFMIYCIYKKLNLLCNRLVAKYSDGKVTNQTPVSLVEVKVTLPTRVIFGDEAIAQKCEPSALAQLPKLRLGEGTLGTLYKAVLDCGSIITVRKIQPEVAKSDDFESWIAFFGGLRDFWLLPIQFSFWYGGEAFVVHEYLCLGSLEELLHGSEGVQFTPLSWKIRLQIALDAAKAVAALHKFVAKDGKNTLICGVIKATNILIRIDFSACLTGYETAYLICPATIIRRNPGRVAPELTHQYSPKMFTQKSDVYSFGVLLLEIITGKRSSVTNLGEYVNEKRRREGLGGVADKKMTDVTENLADVIRIAGLCLSNNPRERPSMDRVVQMIQVLQE